MNSQETTKVDIVIAGGDQGSGHLKAANNLRGCIKEIDESKAVVVINVFDYLQPFLRFLLQDVWRYSSTHLRLFYNRFHYLFIKSNLLKGDVLK